jgi:hypothetical protein
LIAHALHNERDLKFGGLGRRLGIEPKRLHRKRSGQAE